MADEEIVKRKATMDDDEPDLSEEEEAALEAGDVNEDFVAVSEAPYKTVEEIDAYLKANIKKFDYPEFFFGENTNQQNKSVWDTAKLRICVCYFSAGNVRAVSNTQHALETWRAENYGDEVFMDYSFFPTQQDYLKLSEDNMPCMFGNVSHHHLKDYDVLFVSNSVFPEIINIPRAYKNVGIPLSTQQRLKDNNCPLIMLGGAAAPVSHILTGDISANKEDGCSLIDCGNYGPIEGYGERMMSEFFDFMSKEGGVRSHKEEILTNLATKYDSYYVPMFYEFVPVEGYPLRIKEIKKLKEGIPDKVKFSRPYDISKFSFAHKVFYKSGGNADSCDTVISEGCSGDGCCNFCHEGTITGPYRSRTKEQILADFNKAKEMAAPNSMGLFSFNLNFHPDVDELVGLVGENFSQISLINMRIDEVAEDVDLLRLAKSQGQIRMSMAIEGVGERIRNKILNKNLHRPQLMKAVRNVFEQRFIMLKMGMILTGQETKEDIEDFISEIEEIIQIRDEMGAKTSIMLTFTPLVCYDQTALRWCPRITAQNSLENNKTMDYFYELKKAKNLDFRCKFNGRGPGTFIEQMLLDTHRAGTKVLVDAVINRGLCYARNFNNNTRDVFLASLKSFNIDIYDIFRERDTDEVLPSDCLEFATQQRIDKWKEMWKNKDMEMKYCLQTKANPITKCHGCKTCPPDQICNVIKREINAKKVEEVLDEMKVFRPGGYTRFVVNVKGIEVIHNREALAHYIVSLFLRKSESLRDAYYKIGATSTDWASAEGQKDWFTGKYAFDVVWTREVQLPELEALFEEVNKELIDCSVVAVFESNKEMQISIKDSIQYLVKLPDYSQQKLQERIQDFNWQVKTVDMMTGSGVSGIKFKTEYHPEFKDNLVAANKGTDLYLSMVLPLKFTPYTVLNSITGISYEKLVRTTEVSMIDHLKDAEITCNNCNHWEGISLIDNKRRCPQCTGKKLVYAVTRR